VGVASKDFRTSRDVEDVESLSIAKNIEAVQPLIASNVQ